jgi:hypothetical protein
MSAKRKRNAIAETFVAHRLTMRESPAWRALPDNARRILDRLEIEHMRHGGAANGSLMCPYGHFQEAGIRRGSVALAIRQAIALGFLKITAVGYRRAAEFRAPNVYFVTYLHGCGKSLKPTDDWARLQTSEHAEHALKAAAAARNHANQPSPKKQKAGRANEPKPDALASLRRSSA